MKPVQDILLSDERARLIQLRRLIELGLEQLDNGRAQHFDEQVVKRIKQNGRKRVAPGNHNEEK